MSNSMVDGRRAMFRLRGSVYDVERVGGEEEEGEEGEEVADSLKRLLIDPKKDGDMFGTKAAFNDAAKSLSTVPFS